MSLLKKPDDVLPALLSLFGIFIVYSFPLFTPHRLAELDTHYVSNILSVNSHLIKHYADIVNRIVICLSILYILFLYCCYLETMTLVTSIILIASSVFYMALLANAVPMPNIDFFPLVFLSIILWQCCFLMPKTTFYLIISTLIFCVIAFINPVASVCLGLGLIVTAQIIPLFDSKKERYFYNILFILLSGFCSFTLSLLKSKDVQDFVALFEEHYHFPMIISIILIALIICQQLSKKPFIQDIGLNTKSLMLSYGIVTFLGATFIGRFDYIAHFV